MSLMNHQRTANLHAGLRQEPGGEVVLIRIGDAARALSISRSRAYLLARRGELPGALRLGGTWRVNRRALEEWADRAVGVGAEPIEVNPNGAKTDELAGSDG